MRLGVNMRNASIIIGLCLVLDFASAQELPSKAHEALSARFKHWTFRPAHLPSPCDAPDRQAILLSAVQKCDLNRDRTTDYAVAVTTGKDSEMVEYFLALVSRGDSYDVFIIDSARNYLGAGERLLRIIRAGDSTAFFGDEDEVAKHGKLVNRDRMIVFPTDALEISPGCEVHYSGLEYDVYVFIRGRFLNFAAAD